MAKSDLPRVHFRIVAQDYIKTMHIPLIAGRDLTPRDERNSSLVVLINEALARRYFPNENPIGKHIKPGVADTGEEKMREIVGVVGDVHHRNLWQATDPECYVPYDQAALGAMSIVVRAQGEPMNLLPVDPRTSPRARHRAAHLQSARHARIHQRLRRAAPLYELARLRLRRRWPLARNRRPFRAHLLQRRTAPHRNRHSRRRRRRKIETSSAWFCAAA